MGDPLGTVAWGTVEHDEEVMIGVSLREFVQEHLKTPVVHPRQAHTEALPARGFDRRVQIGPLVSAFDDPRRTKPRRTVAPVAPVDKPETRLVESQNL